MREMLEHQPMIGHVPIQHLLAVVLIAAPQDVVVGTCHNLNCVELNEAEFLDQTVQVERACRGRGQALRIEPEAPGIPV